MCRCWKLRGSLVTTIVLRRPPFLRKGPGGAVEPPWSFHTPRDTYACDYTQRPPRSKRRRGCGHALGGQTPTPPPRGVIEIRASDSKKKINVRDRGWARLDRPRRAGTGAADWSSAARRERALPAVLGVRFVRMFAAGPGRPIVSRALAIQSAALCLLGSGAHLGETNPEVPLFLGLRSSDRTDAARPGLRTPGQDAVENGVGAPRAYSTMTRGGPRSTDDLPLRSSPAPPSES